MTFNDFSCEQAFSRSDFHSISYLSQTCDFAHNYNGNTVYDDILRSCPWMQKVGCEWSSPHCKKCDAVSKMQNETLNKSVNKMLDTYNKLLPYDGLTSTKPCAAVRFLHLLVSISISRAISCLLCVDLLTLRHPSGYLAEIHFSK